MKGLPLIYIIVALLAIYLLIFTTGTSQLLGLGFDVVFFILLLIRAISESGE